MCRPAGVSDAAKTGQQCAVVYFFIQNAKPADCFFHMDFLTIKKTPENLSKMIKSACYDCHSNETVYPWYANVQPFGWFLKDHIDEGRRELNFSTFATYEPLRQAKKLNKAAKEVKEGEMPLESYLLMHKEAKLNLEQKELLVTYLLTMKDITMMQNGISEEELKPKQK